jgi:SPP1 gp7 family putative phage head morphogenesis protein
MPRQTANQEYFDAALRHQVGVRRLTAGEVREMMKVLERADRSLVTKLRQQLAPLAGRPRNDLKINRIKDLLRSVRETRRELIGQLKLQFGEQLQELARVEAEFELRMLKGAIPIDIVLTDVSRETLRALVTTKPFSGGASAARTLGQWFNELAQVDSARLIGALQLGIVQGETVDQMMARVAGTRANNFADGVLAVSRRHAETIVRTAVNHVSNAARESVWVDNEDIIAGLKWVATLDGRTSAVCRARDGHIAPITSEKVLPKGAKKLVPASARPPAHPNCRSVMVAILDGEGVAGAIGDRPFVRANKREVNFRELAKKRAGNKWDDLDASARNELVRKARSKWTDAVVGRTPGDTSYGQWLRTQPAEFQDEVLGKTKGALFRRGGLQVEQFVDKAGNELTLEQLAQTNPTAFIRANLDPEDFD